MLRTVGAAFFFILSLWLVKYNVEGGGLSRQCSYVDLCERTVTPSVDCGPWPWCTTYTLQMPCQKQEMCNMTWNEWSVCSRMCGTGRRFRTGLCVGENCRRMLTESEYCNTEPCPETRIGVWSEWSEWNSTACNETCCGGIFTMSRTRICSNPDANRGCDGSNSEVQENMPCPITENCPLSCVNETLSTMFEDPCGSCSHRFFACVGEEKPVELECPTDTYWSSANNTCQSLELCSK